MTNKPSAVYRPFLYECVRELVSPYEHIWPDLPGLSLAKDRVWFYVPSDGYENSKTWSHDWRCKSGMEALEILQTKDMAPESSDERGWKCDKCDSQGSLRIANISDGSYREEMCEDCVDVPKAVLWASLGRSQILRAEELARQQVENMKLFIRDKRTAMPTRVLWGFNITERWLFTDPYVDSAFIKAKHAKPYRDMLDMGVNFIGFRSEAIILSLPCKLGGPNG